MSFTSGTARFTQRLWRLPSCTVASSSIVSSSNVSIVSIVSSSSNVRAPHSGRLGSGRRFTTRTGDDEKKKDDSRGGASNKSTPRRIVVKAKQESLSPPAPNASSPSSNQHDNIQMDISSKVGNIYRRRSKHRGSNSNNYSSNRAAAALTEIKDTAGVAIWLPGRTRPKGPPDAAAAASRHRPKLPTLYASALLNQTEYIKKSATAATTQSGTEAARRLLRGRKDWVQCVRQHVVYPNDNNATAAVHPPTSHALTGHGVPEALLQNHLDLADTLLYQSNKAAEVSFQNWSGELRLDWMRVRSPAGNCTVQPWPVNNEWNTDMDLYLVAMNRLAVGLSVVLKSILGDAVHNKNGMNDDDDAGLDFSLRSVSQQPQPRYWNVKMWRGMAFLPDSLPAKTTPVVEWTPVQGLEAPGHVCIRLQGFPQRSTADEENTSSTTIQAGSIFEHPDGSSQMRRRQRQAVTLSFNACFRNHS